MTFASLTIDINAKIASLEAGIKAVESKLTGLSTEANKTAQSIGALFGQTLTIGTFGAIFNAALTDMAALDDAAEQTGSSVESISAALNTLRANDAGGLAELTELTSRFGRSLANVDKDTSKAAEAFRRLGLNIDDLKGMGRVDAIVEIARAQAKLADDGNKAVIVEAALGRGAASLIPQLNELAKSTREAATVTGEQAAKAESARKQIASLQAQAIAFRNDIVNKILPGFNELLIKLRAFAEIGSAPKDLLDTVFGNEGDLQQRVAERAKRVEQLRRDQDVLLKRLSQNPEGPNGEVSPLRASLLQQVNETNAALELAGARLNQLETLIKRRKDLERNAGLDGNAGPEKPSGDASGLTGDSKDKQSEADKLLQSTLKQLYATQDLNAEQKLALDLALDALPKQGAAALAAAQAAARQTDELSKLNEERKKQADQARDDAKAEEDDYKAVAEMSRKAREEREKLAESYRDTIDPLRKLKQQLEEVVVLERAGALTAQEALLARLQLNTKLDEAANLLGKFKGEGKDAFEELQQAVEGWGDRSADAITEFVTTGKGGFRSLVDSIIKDLIRLQVQQSITRPLFQFLQGGGGDGLGVGEILRRGVTQLAVGGLNPVNLDSPDAYFTPAPAVKSAAAAASVTNIFNIDSRTDRSVIVADIQRAQAGTIAKQIDMQARGMVGV